MSYTEMLTTGKTADQCFMFDALESISVEYPLLDIGGGRHWPYHRRMGTDLSRTVTANLPRASNIDIALDARFPLPFHDQSFSTILCLNLIEHLPQPQQTVSECHRVLTEGGSLIIGVPFLHRIHGDPNDFSRLTDSGLQNLCADFECVSIDAHSPGPVSAASKFMVPMNKYRVLRYCLWRLSNSIDYLFDGLRLYSDDTTNKFPLFYVVKAVK